MSSDECIIIAPWPPPIDKRPRTGTLPGDITELGIRWGLFGSLSRLGELGRKNPPCLSGPIRICHANSVREQDSGQLFSTRRPIGIAGEECNGV